MAIIKQKTKQQQRTEGVLIVVGLIIAAVAVAEGVDVIGIFLR